MTTERRPRPRTPPPVGAPTTELRRIPLPPLPHFKRLETAPRASQAAVGEPGAAARDAPTLPLKDAPAAAAGVPRQHGPVSHLEMSELLGPDHEGGIAPAIEPRTPQRTGATGATIMNDLVDEIEKGLEKELARAPVEVTTQGYRRVVACASGPSGDRAAGPGPSRPAPPPSGRPERRTGE